MGIKYAGTGDPTTVKTIMGEIDKMRKMKVSKCDLTNDKNNKSAIDQYTLFTLLSVSLLALSLVNAGTSDIPSLKMARVIRKKF
jgi:anaphase-promoting complex subunit 1